MLQPTKGLLKWNNSGGMGSLSATKQLVTSEKPPKVEWMFPSMTWVFPRIIITLLVTLTLHWLCIYLLFCIWISRLPALIASIAASTPAAVPRDVTLRVANHVHPTQFKDAQGISRTNQRLVPPLSSLIPSLLNRYMYIYIHAMYILHVIHIYISYISYMCQKKNECFHGLHGAGVPQPPL